ncbi:MAG: hypothetical protein WBV55_03460, partial [Candidatus Sulfotelmatobacter sp.]
MGWSNICQPTPALDIFFLADLNRILERYGNRGYRAVQLEAGAIGGRMYLAMNHNRKPHWNTGTNGSAPFGEEEQTAGTTAPAVRKPISPAKLAANRRNGHKSKGPKTEEGKFRSRWNALKHGVLSQRLVVLNENDAQTYTLLLENLRRDLNPGNGLEEILIEKIAMAYWRLSIAYGYEAEFARSRHEFIVVADRMGRYANTIHRQLLQAMNELERLQRRRTGKPFQRRSMSMSTSTVWRKNGRTDKRDRGTCRTVSAAVPPKRPGASSEPATLQLQATISLLRSRATRRFSFAKRTHR